VEHVHPFIGAGYDAHFGPLTLGPIVSLQYTDVGIDSFSEKGSLAPLYIHSGSAESLRSDVGFSTFYQWPIGKIVLEPSLKAAWEQGTSTPRSQSRRGLPGSLVHRRPSSVRARVTTAQS
jgi:uncharacterized protein with beta-barrel porin domain